MEIQYLRGHVRPYGASSSLCKERLNANKQHSRVRVHRPSHFRFRQKVHISVCIADVDEDELGLGFFRFSERKARFDIVLAGRSPSGAL